MKKGVLLKYVDSVKLIHVYSILLFPTINFVQKLTAKCKLLTTSLPWESQHALLYVCSVASESSIYVAQMQLEITEGLNMSTAIDWAISYSKSITI